MAAPVTNYDVVEDMPLDAFPSVLPATDETISDHAEEIDMLRDASERSDVVAAVTSLADVEQAADIGRQVRELQEASRTSNKGSAVKEEPVLEDIHDEGDKEEDSELNEGDVDSEEDLELADVEEEEMLAEKRRKKAAKERERNGKLDNLSSVAVSMAASSRPTARLNSRGIKHACMESGMWMRKS